MIDAIMAEDFIQGVETQIKLGIIKIPNMTVKKDTVVFIILSGIPCSGKSTWVEKNTERLRHRFNDAPIIVISKDFIRESVYGKSDWVWNDEKEKVVNDKFFKQLGFAATLRNAVVIIDNTHTREDRIDRYFKIFKTMIDSGAVKMYVRFFDVSLYKAKARDILRKFATGKYIPMENMNRYYENYKKIDKLKYKDYIFYDE